MKRIFKIISVVFMAALIVSAVLVSGKGEMVSAEPAPNLSSFQILGVADSNLFNNNQYYTKNSISAVKLPRTIYVVTNQTGYGNTGYYIDGNVYKTATRSKWFPRTNANRIITGWAQYDMLTLTPGNHNIKAVCTNNNTHKSITDSIFVSVQ